MIDKQKGAFLSLVPQRGWCADVLLCGSTEIETAEMMGKFKDLGNSVLGYFGMNVDQFKFDKKPDGGYSLNMN